MTETHREADIANILGDCIGQSKSVLFVGGWNAALAQRLLSAGCRLAALSISREIANVASNSCLTAETLDIESWTVPESVKAVRYDAVVLDGVLELSPNPESMLAEIQTMLKDDGVVAASLPHTAHGAIRLALMRGIATAGFAGAASAREAIEPFERCGYHVRRIHRVLSPLFGQGEGLPALEQSDFDPTIVQEIQADPESETVAFLILAATSDTAHDIKNGVLEIEADRASEEDRFAVAFETAFEAQRHRTQLEEELRAALQELDRLRGRVIALEDALRDQTERLERLDKSRKK